MEREDFEDGEDICMARRLIEAEERVLLVDATADIDPSSN